MKQLLYICLSIIVFYSCEKEIDLDYKPIQPIHVIDAVISDNLAQVVISSTMDVAEIGIPAMINNAQVMVSREDGERLIFYQTQQDSSYKTIISDDFILIDNDYTLSVKIGDIEYLTKSRVYEEPLIGNIVFAYQELTEDIAILAANLQVFDPLGEANTYYYTVNVVGGDPSKKITGVFSDVGSEDAAKIISIPLGVVGGDSSFIKDGDHISIKVREIDRDEYDFYYSIKGSVTSLNPKSAFTGGAIGWFNLWKYEASRTAQIIIEDFKRKK